MKRLDLMLFEVQPKPRYFMLYDRTFIRRIRQKPEAWREIRKLARLTQKYQRLINSKVTPQMILNTELTETAMEQTLRKIADLDFEDFFFIRPYYECFNIYRQPKFAMRHSLS